MRVITIFGAGRQAEAVLHDIVSRKIADRVRVLDVDKNRLDTLAGIAERAHDGTAEHVITTLIQGDVTDEEQVRKALSGANVAIGMTTYKHNLRLTEICIEMGTHFVDLGGNDGIVTEQHDLHDQAKQAGVSIIPDCGLAPGMVDIIGYQLAKDMDHVEHLKLRVGGIPKEIDSYNPLNYNLVFSVHGLINEYVNPCRVIRNGAPSSVDGMSGIECFKHEDKMYEAFNTSGGISRLIEALPKVTTVENMDYKTIRYVGHAEKIRTLMEIGMFDANPLIDDVSPWDMTAQVIERRFNKQVPDRVIARVDLKGTRDDSVVHDVRTMVIDHDETTGLSAMSQATGFPVAIIVDMLLDGRIEHRGVLHQEEVVPMSFMKELEARGLVFTRH